MLLGRPVEPVPLVTAGRREDRDALASVDLVGLHDHKVFAFELAEQAVDVAGGDELQPAEIGHTGAVTPDLEQQPRQSQPSPARQVGIVERAHALRDASVETAQRPNIGRRSLTLVRE